MHTFYLIRIILKFYINYTILFHYTIPYNNFDKLRFVMEIIDNLNFNLKSNKSRPYYIEYFGYFKTIERSD